MIARHFHHVWVGPRPVPQAQIDAWLAMHPGWGHTLWDEDAIRALPLVNRAGFERYLRLGLWHGAVNIARVEIVLKHGGVYLDMDAEPVRSFDGARFMRAGLFAGYVQPRPEFPGLIGNAYIGAIPGHPVLETAVRLIAEAPRLKPPWRMTGVVSFTRAVQAHADRDDVLIMPTRAFFPTDRFGRSAPGRGAIYARHHWGSTPSSGWEYPA